MTMPDVPKIQLNLDEEKSRNIPPYTFVAGGQTMTFTDPAELDWQILDELDSIDTLAEHCMTDEDREAFYKTPLAGYKLGILFEDVLRHFELGEHKPKRGRR